MNIIYYGLSKAYVEEAREWLARVNQYPTFTHAGNTIMALTLKSSLKKPDVVLALLTESEYDKVILNSTNKFKNVKLDKVFVVKTLEDLRFKLEEEFGVPLGVEEVQEKVEVREDVVSEEKVEEKPVEVVVEDEKVKDEYDTDVIKVKEEKVPKKPTSGISKLAITELKEEIAILKREKEELELKLATGGTDVSAYEEKIDELELKSREQEKLIRKQQEDLQTFKESVTELERDLVLKDKELRDVRRGVIKKDMIKVPGNIEFYVSASGVSLMHAYEYLLTENQEGLIVDLSRESFVDVFVKLKSPVRPDKWLVDDINMRAAFTAFDLKLTYDVSPELRLITAPAYALPLGIYDDVKWEEKLVETTKLGIPVMFFLGDVTQEGVIEFANRLEDTPINVLRRDNKLDLRAYNKANKYLESASEVLMRGED